MTPILLRIGAAAFLSVTSLFVVLMRVSPLTSPGIALPLFFITIFLAASSLTTLGLYGLWCSVSIEEMDAGRKITVALREGLFFGGATILLLLFQILGILNWWVAVLIYAVFLFIELALQS
jgi:hypothetical protein